MGHPQTVAPLTVADDANPSAERTMPLMKAPLMPVRVKATARVTAGSLTVCLIAVIMLLFPGTVGADIVRQCNFLTLERQAGAILHGRCLDVTEVTEGVAVPYTEYTFEVLDAVKGCQDENGDPLKTVTFRHAGTSRRRVQPDGTVILPLRFGIPRHKVGEEVVLFLTRESRLGLCSPVGLQQGKFLVQKRGKEARVSTKANARVFRGVTANSFTPAARATFRKALSEVTPTENTPSEDGTSESRTGSESRAAARSVNLKSFLGLCRGVRK